ncbi:MAG: hypothetical protein M1429_04410 [Patescibacteria group bacterium]|nr:hypothetical protein [Patescibacteria group bacterium]
MAYEELMRELPKDIEEASEPGPFKLRNNFPAKPPTKQASSFSVVVLNPILVSSSGAGGKERANKLAIELNRVWNDSIEESRQNPVQT